MSHERHPTHVYTRAGSYNVKLTVTGVNGDVEVVKNNFIVVSAAAAAGAPALAGSADGVADGGTGGGPVAPVRPNHRPLASARATSLLTEASE